MNDNESTLLISVDDPNILWDKKKRIKYVIEPLNGHFLSGIVTRTFTSLYGFELTNNLILLI